MFASIPMPGPRVLRERPDAVIVATGGVPGSTGSTAQHCAPRRDILSGAVAARLVIVYDGTGRHQAVSCALHVAEQGRSGSSSRWTDTIGAEMEYKCLVPFSEALRREWVLTTIDHRFEAGPAVGQRQLVATLSA